MKTHLNIIFLLLFLPIGMQAQQSDSAFVYAKVIDGDTIPMITLEQVEIFSFHGIDTKRDKRRLSRLIRNVKAVYPYAKIAGIKFEKYSGELEQIESKRERKALMKQVEQEIKEDFGDDLRKMTFSQGKILIKLIDRETDNSSYEIVEEFRGAFVAFFWQTFARLFGFNLKVSYDPDGDDKTIETIVLMIENGQI
ncbi:MAG: DUF4294 domain-containing protein [Bacteroidales bacterium]|nr:DUF4294 domain-containing protein [Bacteroidales bacterium]MCF8345398.1 DUF4294 domain-containing protein [Bacteroidales bacterium]MCF8350576.1 DUF4294 domain-containing protein [Bacteroidales bacterium]MCF8377056.1 DUF4294 domain-containing protein [Bacteroidales bacterium]MCF8400930.1 DUF4294 domain-containing protein [Bacteroidales bacterium]